MKVGYVTRSQAQKEDGTFGPVIYTVFEQPLSGFPEADNPVPDNQTLSITDDSITDSTPDRADARREYAQERQELDQQTAETEQGTSDAELFTELFPEQPATASPLQPSSWRENLSAEPWREWGNGKKSLQPRAGVSVRAIQQVGYTLQAEFGLKPVWTVAKDAKRWISECADLWLAAEGDVDMIRKAGKELRRTGMNLYRPVSFYKTVGRLIAEKTVPPVIEQQVLPGGRQWEWA
jgi:hypothetical protein